MKIVYKSGKYAHIFFYLFYYFTTQNCRIFSCEQFKSIFCNFKRKVKKYANMYMYIKRPIIKRVKSFYN